MPEDFKLEKASQKQLAELAHIRDYECDRGVTRCIHCAARALLAKKYDDFIR